MKKSMDVLINNNLRLRKKSSKQKSKVKNLREELKKVKNKLSSEAYIDVCNKAKEIPDTLLKLCKNKVDGKGRGKFDESVKRFAVTLHMKSARAYRYIRKCFANALPCERTLRKWYQKVECLPGFSEPSLSYLSRKAKEFKEKGRNFLCSMLDLHPSLLIELNEHVDTLGSHRNNMIKQILGCYVSLRAKHFCREFSRQSVKIRVQLSKLIFFKNQ